MPMNMNVSRAYVVGVHKTTCIVDRHTFLHICIYIYARILVYIIHMLSVCVIWFI